jgi:AbrB family looped-hinge helix DNA binding protein
MRVGRAKVDREGRITVPKAVRESLGLRAGDHVELVEHEDGVRIRRAIPESAFDAWRGYLTHLAGRDPDEIIDEMRGPRLDTGS